MAFCCRCNVSTRDCERVLAMRYATVATEPVPVVQPEPNPLSNPYGGTYHPGFGFVRSQA